MAYIRYLTVDLLSIIDSRQSPIWLIHMSLKCPMNGTMIRTQVTQLKYHTGIIGNANNTYKINISKLLMNGITNEFNKLYEHNVANTIDTMTQIIKIKLCVLFLRQSGKRRCCKSDSHKLRPYENLRFCGITLHR